MTVTAKQIEQILKTLPIGFYVGKQIGTSMSETEPTSFFNPKNQTIVISSSIIQKGLQSVESATELEIEQAVRSMLYHEVSHAILTPAYNSFPSYFNVFEDERIETILSDFYYNVDFKKQLMMIAGKRLNEPTTTADQYWFKLIRFRYGKAEHLKKVAGLIKAYATIHAGCASELYICRQYFHDVTNFYEEIKKEFSQPNMQLPQTQPLPNEATDLETKHDESTTEIPSAEEIMQAAAKEVKTIQSNLNVTAEQIIKSSIDEQLDSIYDSNQFEELRQIFDIFKQKQGRFAGSSIGYSGSFNSRLTTRKDYKFFVKQNDAGSMKNFNKVKLNLFIDCTGSFRDNADETNRILSSLLLLEKQQPDFSFDVVSVSVGFKLLPKTNRQIVARGCSSLNKSVITGWKAVQAQNAININIVLLDGRFSNSEYFRYLNYKNCCIISDNSNKWSIDTFAPNAKTTYLDKNTRTYASQLFKTLCKALRQQATSI